MICFITTFRKTTLRDYHGSRGGESRMLSPCKGWTSFCMTPACSSLTLKNGEFAIQVALRKANREWSFSVRRGPAFAPSLLKVDSRLRLRTDMRIANGRFSAKHIASTELRNPASSTESPHTKEELSHQPDAPAPFYEKSHPSTGR